jgi:membrane protease YdiL (CAAX protease family)
MRGQLYPSGFVSKMAALAGIWVMSSVFFSLLGVITVPLIFPEWGVGLAELIASGADVPAEILRYVQVFSATGMFVVPALLFAYLVSFKNQDYLKLDPPMRLGNVIMIVLLVIAMVPIVDILTTWMRQITFPESMAGFQAWLDATESNNIQLINKMMAGQSVRDLLANLIVIALLPAVGEELLFRGVLQPLLHERTRSAWLSIGLTSLFFAVLHQQFYNLAGLFFISVILGFIRHWTGNLKYCMWAHFVNNGGFVLLAFFSGLDPSEQVAIPGQMYWVLLSVIAVGAILLFIRKNGPHKQTENVFNDQN